MCVFHQFCIVCFCIYVTSQCVVADIGSPNNASREKEINATGSRDQNVKNVIHVHKHQGKMVWGNISQNSLDEALHYVHLIFNQFGNKNRMDMENLKKLYKSLQFLNGSDHEGSGFIDHGDHKHEQGEHDEHDHQIHEEDHEHEDKTDYRDLKKQNIDSKESMHNGEHNHEHYRNDMGHGDHVNNDMRTVNRTEDERSNGDSKNHKKNRHKRHTQTPHLDSDHTKCLEVQGMLKVYHFENEKYLSGEQFLHLCPAVIYQLYNQRCRVIDHSGHVHMEGDTLTSETVGFSEISAAVWGYSTLAVIIISLVGLLGVAVIPIMQKVFYNHLLQFLVALAVGALTGDALLHLLPHAIAGESLHDHDDHDSHGHGSHKTHQSAVLKGLCGLAGLFFFFLMERVLTIFTKIKRKRKQSKRRTLSPKQITECKDDGNHIAKKLSAYEESDYQSCEEMIMVVHPNKSLKGYADETHDKVFHTSHDGCHPKEPKHSHSNPQTAEEEGMLSLPHSHSGHSHHAHCEMLTNSVASVAWMVILGDGIHNFSDGLAIGAAFANSITGGFSTAIAVFCHELPHEIGDFAVLLRAGMSVKQAVVYNILSSVLCFIGMLIGVAIGNIDEASQWIFAAVAGMFIYIATVDMLPEMTSVDTKQGEHPFFHLFLQCVGMIVGAGIMLLIAFFEEDLLRALDG